MGLGLYSWVWCFWEFRVYNWLFRVFVGNEILPSYIINHDKGVYVAIKQDLGPRMDARNR